MSEEYRGLWQEVGWKKIIFRGIEKYKVSFTKVFNGTKMVTLFKRTSQWVPDWLVLLKYFPSKKNFKARFFIFDKCSSANILERIDEDRSTIWFVGTFSLKEKSAKKDDSLKRV